MKRPSGYLLGPVDGELGSSMGRSGLASLGTEYCRPEACLRTDNPIMLELADDQKRREARDSQAGPPAKVGKWRRNGKSRISSSGRRGFCNMFFASAHIL